MRLDKYLKVSRIIKRRTVAKDVCDGGKSEGLWQSCQSRGRSKARDDFGNWFR